MPATIRTVLLRCIQLLSYGYALLVPLMSCPLRWRRRLRHQLQMRYTRLYVAYSPVVHCLCVAAMPRALPWATIIWSFSVSIITKAVALFAAYALTWCRRRRLIAALRSYHLFLHRYRHQRWNDEAACLRAHLERLMIAKFVTGHVVLLLGLRIFFLMNSSYANAYTYVVILFGNCLITTFQLLRLQFGRVNAALRAWQQRLRQLLQPQLNPQQTPHLNDFTRDLATLSTMHFDCYRLTQCVLQLYGLPFGGYMLREVAVMVNMLFHTVQFMTARIVTDKTGNANGSSMVTLYIVDTVLLAGMVDGVMATCNVTSALLRDCNEILPPMSALRTANGDWAQLTRELELFANRLNCHRLCYKVCGMFELNRSTCLGLMRSALVHVTVLMQFDLKLRQKSESMRQLENQ